MGALTNAAKRSVSVRCAVVILFTTSSTSRKVYRDTDILSLFQNKSILTNTNLEQRGYIIFSTTI
jgi:hypothetical protein